MSNPFLSAFTETPSVNDIESSSQRIVFGVLSIMVLVLASGYTVLHFAAGRHLFAFLTATMVAAALATGYHAHRTKRFDGPLRLLAGTVAGALAIATLSQGPALPAAGWWLSVMPFLLAAGGLHRMALGMVFAFLVIVTWLFVGGPVPLPSLPAEEDVSAFRRYAAVAGSELLALAAISASMNLRAKVARALESARADALEASAIKARFLANMSHEIRSPLAGIIGVADVLDAPGLSEAQRRQLIGLQRQSASTLLALVNDILDASKLDANKVVLESLPFDLRLIVQEVNELFAMQAFGKGIELTSSWSPDLPAAVIGDAVRVRQIVTNLAGNAVKFTRRGGVHLHAALDPVPDGDAQAAGPRTIRIEVSDTGPGIPADRVKLLFRPFVQADEAVTRQYGGTGLGLSISAELSRLMGGGIEVRSSVGEGSTFTARLALPAASARPPATAPRLRPDVVLASSGDGLERHAKTRLRELGIDPVVRRDLPEGPGLAVCRWLLVDAPLLDGPGAAAWLAAQQAAGREVLVLAPLGADAIAGTMPHGRLIYKPVHRDALQAALLATPAAEPAPAAALPDRGPAATTQVLVADDNPVNQIVVKEMLAALGIDATVVADGLMALDALGRRSYDLVLMDVNMPTMNGLDATRALRDQEARSGRRRATVLAMTASTETEDGPICRDAGMDGFLPKPFGIAQLRAALDHHLQAGTRAALALA